MSPLRTFVFNELGGLSIDLISTLQFHYSLIFFIRLRNRIRAHQDRNYYKRAYLDYFVPSG